MMQAWTVEAADTPERVAMLNTQLARDLGLELQQQSTRNATRMVSALSTFATLLLLYDVLMLVRGELRDRRGGLTRCRLVGQRHGA